MRRVAIIQARTGSRRLPGKVLLPLAGRPVIEWVVDRAARIPGLDAVAVATSTAPGDDRLEEWCSGRGVAVVRGSEHDVLERYVEAARLLDADVVMRLTADCPFLDPAESARVLACFEAVPGCEYASNLMPRFLPDGLDTEVVHRATLERLAATVEEADCREHVTLYIRRHLDRFVTAGVTDPRDLGRLRLTLDDRSDYRRLAQIATILADHRRFGHVEELLALLEERPELAALESEVMAEPSG